MKKLVGILIAIVLSTATMAQAPQAFAFQSSISDTSGNPLSNRGISVKFTIHQSSASGTVVYEETQADTTSPSGYFSANVGQGTLVSGTFSGISWGTDTYWLEVSVDTTGGSTFVSLGSSQLLSVPYALNAGNVGGLMTVFEAVEPSSSIVGPANILYSTIHVDMDHVGSIAYSAGTFTAPVDGVYRVEFIFNGDLTNVGYLYVAGNLEAQSNNSIIYERLHYLSAGQTVYTTHDGPHGGATLRIVQER